MPTYMQKKIAARMVVTHPVSKEFPLLDVEAGDVEDLTANMLEALCLLTRHRDRLMRRHAPLHRISAFKPEGSDKPLSEMSATELALLVVELRERADRERAVARIESDMHASE